MLREAQVNSAFAHLYPSLDPGRWYTAAAIAGYVKGTRIIQEGPDARFPDRILPGNHFRFRGGTPRGGGSLGLRSRRIDRYRPARTHLRIDRAS
jgi:hypothetical protein